MKKLHFKYFPIIIESISPILYLYKRDKRNKEINKETQKTFNYCLVFVKLVKVSQFDTDCRSKFVFCCFVSHIVYVWITDV